MFVYYVYMPATQRGKKKVLDPLEEEIFVSHHPDGCWESKLGSLEEKPVLFNYKATSPPPKTLLRNFNVC